MKIKTVQIAALARNLRIFTDPLRLKIIFLLLSARKEHLCVSEVADHLKSSLSTISHQLRKLELAGLVEPVRKESNFNQKLNLEKYG